MKGEVIVIYPDKPTETRALTAPPELESLQRYVGGWIEKVPAFDNYEGKMCIVLCNEEGKLKQLPINVKATELWSKANGGVRLGDVLVGTVLIITGDREFMEEL